MIDGLLVNDDVCTVGDLSFCGAVQVVVPADASWDEFVATAVARDWVGLETLSGRPGTVADAVTANHAGYGQSVADTVASVRTRDRDGRQRTFAYADCGFGPGRSRFQVEDLDLLDVSFLMRQGDLTPPVRDQDLAALLGIRIGERVPLSRVREVLLAQPMS